ncbi:MAG: hypothetical protein ACP5NV_01080 [Candidatus Woesearchaeota archaeon]
MRYEPTYNRIHTLDMWESDWSIDKNGNLVLQEEGIPMENVRFGD